jgi:putative tricarboxylic transport membrane protein
MDGVGIAWNVLTGSPVVFAAFAGVAWGIVGGALPGISPSIAMALLLPFTYAMQPVVAIVLLASVYVGAEYGGSIPAILIRTPGTNAAAATAIDGYEMHRRGRGGEALGISLMAGVIGGLIGLLLTVLVTEPLARVALLFTPPAYFALGILGLSVIASLAEGSLIKGFMAGVVGLMIATVGSDPQTGIMRYTFGQAHLIAGIPPVLVMIGVFAVSELMVQAGRPPWSQTDRDTRIKLPSLGLLWRLRRALGIGSGIGAFEGAMPGAGGTIAAFMSYNEARRWSKHPEEFGKGSAEAIAAPEAANNTVTATTLVPTLAFGVPGSNSAAILLTGLLLHGLIPGPLLFEKHPDLVYGLFAGLFVANFAQLPLGLLILTPCIWLVNRPKPYILAFVYALVFTGVYAIDGSMFQVGLALGFGVLGYLLRWLDFPFLPLVLGVILGYMVESNYRRALQVSGGDHAIFVEDPVSAGLLGAAVALVILSLVRDRWRARKPAGGETAA